MKAKAIEIRWHNTKPIYSTDFQTIPPSNLNSLIPNRSHPYLQSELDKQVQQLESEIGCGQVWRLATAGGDNLVMMWLVYPKPTMAQVNQHRNAYQSTGQPTPPTLDPKSFLDHKHNHPPIVEYLATLTKHQGVVNVVRFCPRAEMLASAGDDGNVLLWVLSTNPIPTAFGESAADKAYERESWRTRLMLRGPAQCEIYDLAWSPCGDFILTGDTAKTARIWNVTDGSCIKQIAEHSNFVQGVAWDPLGEYIATQSSDRSMNVYSVQLNKDESGSATAEIHHVAKNYKIDLLNQQTSSWSSFPNLHHERDDIHPSSARSLATSTSFDTRSDTSAPTSVASAQTPKPKPPPRTVSNTSNVPESPSHLPSPQVSSSNRVPSAPPTPSTAASTLFNEDSSMQPPSEIPRHTSLSSISTPHVRNLSNSRQSSVVSSQAMSPSSRPIRSPSPVPPLPAIHVNEEKRSSSVLLYGDEGASAFFRRLTWSNDGSTLITPAGRWENRFTKSETERKGSNGKGKGKEIERGVSGETSAKKRRRRRTATNDLIVESDDEADQAGGQDPGKESPTVFIYGRGAISASSGNTQACQPLARLPGHKSSSVAIRFSPVIYRLKALKSAGGSKKSSQQNPPPLQVELAHGSPMQEIDLNKLSSHHQHHHQQQAPKSGDDPVAVFDLPYRMIYAVATHDTVYIYDTQQSSPICLFNNLHFSSFTDLSWTNDGETLVLSSSDGYCSLVIFDKGELGDRLTEEEVQEHLPAKFLRNMVRKEEEEIISATHPVTPVPISARVGDQNSSNTIGSNSKQFTKGDAGEVGVGKISAVPSAAIAQPDSATDGLPQKKKKRVALTYEGPVKG
ncbi:hypothetical protein PGT21_006473 [Puccinia graminis f. sp. tritici]|uniref:CAF1B/HIR1 beta-propeller domain-containing protein n=1 Tax=Puccinia graminis f. sp. tritici TaxID=56615 RepID=A0A5B0RW97_PUCGR|nr:hypothetical protein PGT21_006473 [Puccinia graminis f. sp. tritici]KAA1129877.1 hypothetical protein PGTUg99_006003 [Puccinia graminis f. sp. tritici]